MTKQPIDKFELYLMATIKTIQKSYDKYQARNKPDADGAMPDGYCDEDWSGLHASTAELTLAQTILAKYRETKKKRS
jgi:hypothetical protein